MIFLFLLLLLSLPFHASSPSSITPETEPIAEVVTATIAEIYTVDSAAVDEAHEHEQQCCFPCFTWYFCGVRSAAVSAVELEPVSAEQAIPTDLTFSIVVDFNTNNVLPQPPRPQAQAQAPVEPSRQIEADERLALHLMLQEALGENGYSEALQFL